MDWTDAVILSLRALWDEGLSTAEIGRRLGVTKNAVVGKAHRLVLPARPSPIRRGASAMVTPRRATGPTLPSMELPKTAPQGAEYHAEHGVPVAVLPALADSAVRPQEAAIVPAAVEAAPVRIVAASQPAKAVEDEDAVEPPVRPAAVRSVPSLRPVAPPRRQRVVACCWPIGEPGTRSFRFCDAESMAGKPYCDSHAQLVYVKVRDRREDAA